MVVGRRLSRPRQGTMPIEAPLLRVSRPVAACVRCRSAKIKCDGKLPACTACEKSNKAAECSSASDDFARGKERSYVATLEAKVDRLQKKLDEARAKRPSAMTEDGHTSGLNGQAVAHSPVPRRPNTSAARRKEASDIDDLVGDFGLLAVSATARDFHGFTSTMSYARLILAVSQKEILPAGLYTPLPLRHEATMPIQHFLDHIFIFLPIFEEASFYASVDAVYSNDPRRVTAFDHWTVRMVLAVANMSFSNQHGDKHHLNAIGHLNAALDHAEQVLRPGSISSIQAILLLVAYAMLDPHLLDCWTLVGAASRAMVDIGLHQDPSRSSSTSKSKLDLRRRIFWCIYVLDRSTSIVQTRSFSFSDESAKVALPFNAGDFDSPLRPKNSETEMWLQSVEPALELFRLRRIQSIWYKELFQSGRTPWTDPYRYVWQTHNDLTKWWEALSPRHSCAIRGYFELELLYSYVYVLSPSPRVPQICAYAQKLIFEHCAQYSGKLLRVVMATAYIGKPPLTFYDMMRAYMTGRQFIDVLARNPDTVLGRTEPSPPIPDSSSMDLEVDTPYPPAPRIVMYRSAGGDNIGRAIGTLNDFTTILSILGLQFGYPTWRERFQKEAAPLLGELHYRRSAPPQLDTNMDSWPTDSAAVTSPYNSVSSVLATDFAQSIRSQPYRQHSR